MILNVEWQWLISSYLWNDKMTPNAIKNVVIFFSDNWVWLSMMPPLGSHQKDKPRQVKPLGV